MPKIEEKKKIVADIEEKLRSANLVIFADYRNINVEEMSDLRNKLRAPGVEFKVLKNTMTRFAVKNLGYEDLIEHIEGPNAVLFSNEDMVGPAKTMYDFIKQYKKLEIKIGVLEGRVVAPDDIKALADLPSKEVLLAQVVGTMQAPITSFAYVLQANLSGLVRALNQVKEQKEAS
jgi:large subunit ribosomal protein L10